MPDRCLDGRASPEFAFDDAEDATLLAGDEHATRIWHGVTTVGSVTGLLGSCSTPAWKQASFLRGREGLSRGSASSY